MKGLGVRIRSLRKERNLTLVEVADKTEIDQATLSRIENGIMIGTVNSHMRIAEVLGVKISDLYEDAVKKIHETKDKIAKRKIESLSNSEGVTAELLTTGVYQRQMMPVFIRLKPEGYSRDEKFAALTERFVYVLKGELQVTVGEESKTLNTGESLYFNASNPHSFRNSSTQECRYLSIISPVSV